MVNGFLVNSAPAPKALREPRQKVGEDDSVIAILSVARVLPPEIPAFADGQGAGRTAVIDLGGAPAPGCGFLGRLRHLLLDNETEAVALVLDQDTPFGDAALSLLAAEGWRRPVVVHFAPEHGTRRLWRAASGNVISFAHARRRRILRALSGMGIAVTTSPAQLNAKMNRALKPRVAEWPRNDALLDFASAIHWVDRNVY